MPRTKRARDDGLGELSTLEAWRATSEARRRSVARAVARASGLDLAASEELVGRERLPRLIHRPTSIDFVAVPGGAFMMGMREEELEEILRIAPPESADYVRALADVARPVRQVTVAPFLCARAPVLQSLAEHILGPLDEDVERPCFDEHPRVAAYLTRDEAGRAARAIGLRIVCEAEWEWVARDGGHASWPCVPIRSPDPDRARAPRALYRHPRYGARPPAATLSAFGVWGLLLGEWTADQWHSSYRRAPSRAVAWGSSAREGIAVVRAAGAAVQWPWQSADEFVNCHAAVRHQRDVAPAWAVRLALDLPS